jgi:DNA-binding NarL/FixJ family response regulator
MADYTSGRDAPNPELIYYLIEQSSLGSPEAQEISNRVPPEIAMKLREETCPGKLSPRWSDLPASEAVLRCLGSVFPHYDGSVELSFALPPTGTIIAVDTWKNVRSVDRSDLRLPGRSQRTQWWFYQVVYVPDVWYRCEFNIAVRMASGRALDPKLDIGLAVAWRVVDLHKLLRGQRRIVNVTDLTPMIEEDLARLFADRALSAADLPTVARVERRIEELFDTCGISAEVSAQIVLLRRPPSVSAASLVGASDRRRPPGLWANRSLLRLMRTVEVHDAAGDTRALLGRLLRLGCRPTGVQRAFIERVSGLVEALRVAGATPEVAIEAAAAAMEDLFSVWDRFPADEHESVLAAFASRELSGLGQHFDAGGMDELPQQRGDRSMRSKVIGLFQDGLDVKDIAEELGLPVEEVERHLRACDREMQRSRYEPLGSAASNHCS